jgi:pyruvate ferredoxin oxidoreductase delta subunit
MFGPLVTKPLASRNNKTGSWRMGLVPKFLKKNCIGCKMCALICPENCFTGKEKNTFDYDPKYCKGCGNCAVICPKSDILMVKEEGKE